MAHILARNPEIELKAPQTVVRKTRLSVRVSTPRYQFITFYAPSQSGRL